MKAKVNGIEIHYEIHGKEGAPWLVLSHSLACSVRMWDPQVEAFKDRYRILNYDMRGHGAERGAEGPVHAGHARRRRAGLMQELKIGKAIYCGLSMGGMIGQTLALSDPGRFERMVLADTDARAAAGGAQAMGGAHPHRGVERHGGAGRRRPWSAGSPSRSARTSPPAQKIAELIARRRCRATSAAAARSWGSTPPRA